MATIQLTSADMTEQALREKGTILVDFWAPWCPPCRAIAPSLEELSDELAGKLQVVKVDIDEHPELARRYGVRSIPALKVFVDGNVAKELFGAMPKQALRAELAAFV